MEIRVMGPGCKNCIKLEELTKAAVKDLGLDVEVKKVSDMLQISLAGVMLTPGLVVNGKVKHSGMPLPSEDKLKTLIKEEI